MSEVILSRVKERFKEKSEELKNQGIKLIEETLSTESDCAFWELYATMDQIIIDLEKELIEEKVLDDTNDLEKMLETLGTDIENELFDILIKPVKENFTEDKYTIKVSYLWRELRVYNK